MTTTTDKIPATVAEHTYRQSSTGTFLAVLQRDVLVAVRRDAFLYLAQVIIQPFFLLFIFGTVLGKLGYIGEGFASILFPGIIAMNAFIIGLQYTAMPLVFDFSFTREVEDRLLAPIPLYLVGLEKILFGALRGLIAALIMVPIGFILLDGISWPVGALLPAVGIVALGSLAGATIGMTLGTLVTPRHINVMFTVAMVPLMFTGATQFPLRELDELRWFQVVCGINPMTYVSEGLRGLLASDLVTSLPVLVSTGALIVANLVFGGLGLYGFNKRARD